MAVLIRHEKTPLEAIIRNLRDKEVKIGWFPSARYPDEDRTPVAAVAAQNEFGNPSKHIPARPFLRPAIRNNTVKWLNIGERGVKAVLAGKEDITAVLDAVGTAAVGDIKKSIERVFTPVLSQRTIDARIERHSRSGKFNKKQAESISKPLVDTGRMISTVSYEIS